ncbi:MAG: LysR substrate-binding domain-containing protein [Gemmatimonadaceae bacterium]
MLLRHFRHLVTVAELGSIAAAAQRLRVAQPALSREIRRMEARLGFPLVERDRRGVRPTAAGAALVSSAPTLFARLDQSLAAARDAHAGLRGRVRIGLSRLALDSPRVGRAIAAARERFPGIQLDLSELPAMSQTEALRARECDLAIGAFGGPDDSIRRAALYDEVVDSVMLPASHALARARPLTLSALAGETFLWMMDPHVRVDGAELAKLPDALASAGITQVERHGSVESMYLLVAAGRGWTLATHASRALPPAGTTVVPLEGFSVPVTLYVRWRAHAPSRSCENVVQALVDAMDQDGGNGSGKRRGPQAAAERTGRRRRRAAKSQGLELRHLEALVAAAEEGSLSRAAERMGLTQSGVSRRLHTLEQEVGCRLLERTPHGVRSTGAGEVLCAESRELLRQFEDTLSRVRRMAAVGVGGGGGDSGGWCRIGALPPELTGSLQLAALARVVETRPEVRLDLYEMLPEAQAQALLDGRIDVGIGGMFAGMELGRALSSVMLTDDPVDCAMLPESHPLASRAWVTTSELSREPFLFVPRVGNEQLHDAVMRGFARIGLVPRMGDSFGGPRSVWRGVADGMGWTLGSRSQRSHPPPGLVAVPVEGLNIPWGISLLWRRDEDDPSVRHVLDAFRETRNPEVAVVVATVRASLGAHSVAAQH